MPIEMERLYGPSIAAARSPLSAWSALSRGYCRMVSFQPVDHGLTFLCELGRPAALSQQRLPEFLELLAQGANNTLIAAELRISEATVSRLMVKVLDPLLCSRGVLPVIARVMKHIEAPTGYVLQAAVRMVGPPEWSESERAVALLVMQGLHPVQIATLRNTTIATVRYQLRAAARKAGCCDRYELGASGQIRLSWTVAQLHTPS